MPSVTIPGLNRGWLRGWPLVAVIGVGLTAVALLHGAATDDLDSSACTVAVQAPQVTVRAAPSPSAQALDTLSRGDEVSAEAVVDGGFRKLTDGERWVPANSVAATAGSQC